MSASQETTASAKGPLEGVMPSAPIIELGQAAKLGGDGEKGRKGKKKVEASSRALSLMSSAAVRPHPLQDPELTIDMVGGCPPA